MAGSLEEFPVVPSGYKIHLQELMFEVRQDNSRVARLRYVMPVIGQDGVAFADIETDFADLCEAQAIPVVKAHDDPIDQVIISFSDRETEFGVSSPVATQYFEAFRIENGTCIWEGF